MMPGSDPNSINLKTNSKRKGKSKSVGGMLPVAVFPTDDFDALDEQGESIGACSRSDAAALHGHRTEYWWNGKRHANNTRPPDEVRRDCGAAQ